MEPVVDETRITKTKISVEAIEAFNNLSPYLIKLFTHIVVFYHAVNGYLSYLQSNDDFSDFIGKMSQPLITRIDTYDSLIDCASANMTDINAYTFSKISAGCQCDDIILVKIDCNFLSQNSSQNLVNKINSKWNKKMQFLVSFNFCKE